MNFACLSNEEIGDEFISQVYSCSAWILKCGAALKYGGMTQEEFLSEVFVRALARRDTYSPARGAMTTWLSWVCRSTASELIAYSGRAKRKGKTVSIDSLVIVDHKRTDDNQDLMNQVHAALSRISKKQRDVVLARLQGRTYVDIAKEQGTTKQAAKSCHQNAIASLQSILKDGVAI